MTQKLSRIFRPATLALNAGLEPDALTHAIAPNISMSVNNSFVPGDGAFSANGLDLTETPFLYAGWTNPTVRQLEERLAALENTEDAYATATGMAAMAAVFFSLLKSGDHLIISDVCYAAINELALQVMPSFGVEVTAVNLSRIDEVVAAIKPNTRLIHAETPNNPLLRLTDLQALSEITRAKNILLSVDSTFATPVLTRPGDFGADLVVHSLTKFINGHGDALGGCVESRCLSGGEPVRSECIAHHARYRYPLPKNEYDVPVGHENCSLVRTTSAREIGDLSRSVFTSTT